MNDCGFVQTDGEASYEIQMEGEVECDDVAVAAAEVDAAGADVPKDNGEVLSTGLCRSLLLSNICQFLCYVTVTLTHTENSREYYAQCMLLFQPSSTSG